MTVFVFKNQSHWIEITSKPDIYQVPPGMINSALNSKEKIGKGAVTSVESDRPQPPPPVKETVTDIQATTTSW